MTKTHGHTIEHGFEAPQFDRLNYFYGQMLGVNRLLRRTALLPREDQAAQSLSPRLWNRLWTASARAGAQAGVRAPFGATFGVR